MLIYFCAEIAETLENKFFVLYFTYYLQFI